MSVVIPTYNRRASLERALRSLAVQGYPVHEVIVVDDGSLDGTHQVVGLEFPFALHYLVQPNRGATQARNLGAHHCTGELLVFMDDDIELRQDTIAVLAAAQEGRSRAIVLGTLLSAPDGDAPPAGQDALEHTLFTECFTGLLSIKSEDFVSLGMFQDPTGGWPNWDDIDFGYRAHMAGYTILRSGHARAVHHDVAASDLSGAARRWFQASQSAVRLFQKYPEMQAHLPMFYDKTPIDWRRDGSHLVVRKLARSFFSSRPLIWGLERLEGLLRRRHAAYTLLRKVRIWILGGYMYRGFRKGMQLHGPLAAARTPTKRA